MATPFDRVANAELVDLIESYPLAWVVSHGADAFAATPLPMTPLMKLRREIPFAVSSIILSNGSAMPGHLFSYIQLPTGYFLQPPQACQTRNSKGYVQPCSMIESGHFPFVAEQEAELRLESLPMSGLQRPSRDDTLRGYFRYHLARGKR
jgi:hypothetical protein